MCTQFHTNGSRIFSEIDWLDNIYAENTGATDMQNVGLISYQNKQILNTVRVNYTKVFRSFSAKRRTISWFKAILAYDVV